MAESPDHRIPRRTNHTGRRWTTRTVKDELSLVLCRPYRLKLSCPDGHSVCAPTPLQAGVKAYRTGICAPRDSGNEIHATRMKKGPKENPQIGKQAQGPILPRSKRRANVVAQRKGEQYRWSQQTTQRSETLGLVHVRCHLSYPLRA